MERTILCVYANETSVLPDSFCDDERRPQTSAICSLPCQSGNNHGQTGNDIGKVQYENGSGDFGIGNVYNDTENGDIETGIVTYQTGSGDYETGYGIEETGNVDYETGSGDYEPDNYDSINVNYKAGKVTYEPSSGNYEAGSGYETENEDNEDSSGNSESNILNGEATTKTGNKSFEAKNVNVNGIIESEQIPSKIDLFERKKVVTTSGVVGGEENEAKQSESKVGHYDKGSRHFEIAGGPKETGSEHSETGNEAENKGNSESIFSLGTLDETKGEDGEVLGKFLFPISFH